MPKTSDFTGSAAAVAATLLSLSISGNALGAEGVRLTEAGNSVRVEIDGKLFTEYHFKNVAKPYCHPIIGPGDAAMTRDWPIKETANEDKDHPHHQSLWYGHIRVNDQDFWGVTAKAGKTVHDEFTKLESGPKVGTLASRNKWVAANGTVVMTDERTLRFYNRADDRVMDFEITLKASEGDITLGDDKDAGMNIRLAETMRLKPNKFNTGKPTGHIVLSTGVRDVETWGKRAEWCDYYGPVNDKTVGVAIFDHPGNPRHPTWWHVRDYGLFTANAFGQHHFENLPDRNKGNLTIPKGQSVTFRYRFYFHEGDTEKAKVAERYKDYVGEVKAN